MPVTYNQLAAMLAIVDCGTFDRAARRLNLTQSTITKRIQELEASLAFDLFDRTKRQAVLTPIGEQFVERARTAVSDFEQLSRFNPDREPAKTNIRFGTTELSSLTWLPKFLESAFSKMPHIQFDLTIDMSRDLLSALEDRELDIIVVPEMPFPPSAQVQVVSEVDVTLIGKPGLIPGPGIASISDLLKFEIIMQGRSSGYSKSIHQWFSDYGFKIRNTVRVDSLHAMVGLAMAGRGLCVTPKDYLKPLIESRRIAEVEIHPPLPKINYCLVCNSSSRDVVHQEIAAEVSQAADFTTPYFS